MSALYDTIGVDYSRLRKPDWRIAAVVERALGPAKTILNVGAGTGSYEPADRSVTALEPSAEMIRQRPASPARLVRGHAEELPFADRSFDAAMAILTVHHWTDKKKGLEEMRRVTRGPVVLLTYDPSFRGFWLADYLPELVALDEAQMPRMADYARWLGAVDIAPVLIPHDCTDGFLCAYWRRPAAYLDPKVRTAMSSFRLLGDVSRGLESLARDLETGAWARAHADLVKREACDLGYRLVVAT
ncbi:MAG: class I SAM-dependent methyltransferase [Alphaproteobacteria bacterium]|nr:class I SAM-dependent methyltransferase [Alphaproteobacteria bacterium]